MPDSPKPSGTTVTHADLLACHRALDSLALYVIRYTTSPDECFKAVELLQKQAAAFGFPITTTFSPEYWKEQSEHAVANAGRLRRIVL